MSQENVEGVQALFEAWQRDDFAAFLSEIHPNIEWHAVLQRLVEGPESLYRGHDGMQRFWSDYRTELSHMQVEAKGLRDVGDDRVLLLVRFQWRGVASGIAMEWPVGLGMTVSVSRLTNPANSTASASSISAISSRAARRASLSLGICE